MATRKSRKPAKKVKSLPAKNVAAKQARGIKGGGVNMSPFNITKTVDKSSP